MAFLEYLLPVFRMLPEVIPPDKHVPFRSRFAWTFIVLVVFLVCCQVPLYGVRPSEQADPLYWIRVVLASNRGSLMELGISPIATSSMIVQLIVGFDVISLDLEKPKHREIYGGIQKLGSMIMCGLQATIYVMSGMYGDVATLGWANAVLIILQLFSAGVMVILLDEILSKGYGMGAGTSLFIATHICEDIMWKMLSPTTVNIGTGPEFEGALIALFFLVITRPNKLSALREAFFRKTLPNLTNLIATAAVFLVVIYVQGFKVELPLKNIRTRGTTDQTFPIKIFYTSNIPIILQSALMSNLYFFSQLLHQRFGRNFFVRLFGDWKYNTHGRYIPIGGLAYYISPPGSITEALTNPIHTIVYVCFVTFTCACFSVLWLEVGNQGPKHVARMLEKQGLAIRGYREQSVVKILQRYIPTAAALGGVCIAFLTMFADFMGAIGSGTGILLAVEIIYKFFETYSREQKMDGGILSTSDTAFF